MLYCACVEPVASELEISSFNNLHCITQMAAGLMTKATYIAITLLVVNTVGYYIFDRSQVPSWLHAVTTSTASTNCTYDCLSNVMLPASEHHTLLCRISFIAHSTAHKQTLIA